MISCCFYLFFYDFFFVYYLLFVIFSNFASFTGSFHSFHFTQEFNKNSKWQAFSLSCCLAWYSSNVEFNSHQTAVINRTLKDITHGFGRQPCFRVFVGQTLICNTITGQLISKVMVWNKIFSVIIGEKD